MRLQKTLAAGAMLLLLAPLSPLIAVPVSAAPAPESVTDFPSALAYLLADDAAAGRTPGQGGRAEVASLVSPLARQLLEDPLKVEGLVLQAKAIRTAHDALVFSAQSRGLSFATSTLPAVDGTSLTSLFDEFYASGGIVLTTDQRDQLVLSIDGLQPALADALAQMLQAYNAARSQVESAYATLTPAERDHLVAEAARADNLRKDALYGAAISAEDAAFLESYDALNAKVDHAALHAAADLLDAQSASARAALAAAGLVRPSATTAPTTGCPGLLSESANDGCVVFEDPTGLVLVTGQTGARVRSTTALHLDLGGDTIYENNAGGASASLPASLTLDLGGLDTYANRGAPAIASSQTGLGMLLDFGAAPDRYLAKEHGVASSLSGLSLLFDDGGPDLFGAQAKGIAHANGGTALLMSMGSEDDRFRLTPDARSATETAAATGAGQSYATGRGLALLVDEGGNDEYLATGASADDVQASSAGGVAWLIDAGGEASFLGGSRSQAATAGGVSMLVGGSNPGPGMRSYLASSRSQAFAHEVGLAILAAFDGDSVINDYLEGATEVQGYATGASAAMVYDAGGNDIFEASGSGQGSAGSLASALLANMAGIDGYSRAGTANDAITSSGTGVLVDSLSDNAPAIAAQSSGKALERLGHYRNLETSKGILHLPLSQPMPDSMLLDGVAFEGEAIPLVSYYMPAMPGELGTIARIPADWSQVPAVRCVESRLNYQNKPCTALEPTGTSSPLATLVPPIVAPGLPSLGVITPAGSWEWRHNADSLTGWTQSANNMWHTTTYRAVSGSSFHFGFDTNPPSYQAGNDATVTGWLMSPAVTLPQSVSGKPLQLSFQQWHQVEEYGEGVFDVMQLRICPTDANECVPIGQWDSQGHSHYKGATRDQDEPWAPESFPVESWAGRTIRFQFVFDSRDNQFNGYEGWFLDNFILSQGEPVVLRQIVAHAHDWHETTNNGRQTIERMWTYEHIYSDGSKKNAYRVEQFISIDSHNMRQEYVDHYVDVDGRNYEYHTISEYVKKGTYASNRRVQPYDHYTYDQGTQTWKAPTAGSYYAWYKVWEKFSSEGPSGHSWGSDKVYERTYIHLIPNAMPNGAVGEPLDPKSPEVEDKNGNDFWVGLKLFSAYKQDLNAHNQDANWMVHESQEQHHSSFSAGIHVLELDAQLQTVAKSLSLSSELTGQLENYLETKHQPKWQFIKGAFSMTLKGFLAGWLLDVVQSGDLAGIWIEEADTPSACLFGVCAAAAYMGVTSTPSVVPFGLPIPVPSHLMPDDGGWDKTFDVAKEIGQRFQDEAPPSVVGFSDSFEGFSVSWKKSDQANLWHQSGRRSTDGTRGMYFGLDQSGHYDTGQLEVGYIMSPEIQVPQGGVRLEFDVWMEHEVSTNYYADVFHVYWYDGSRFHFLKEWDSIDSLPQGIWLDQEMIDMTKYAGQKGHLVFHVSTIDEYYNAFEGWYVDNVKILSG